ncbi:sialate O-acetylesterase [Flammeovirgaceae bacterium SG7u.111]|nr:sialate O-acetylesterase [Flammeovirgaceae bacterium SG7u.132]WPO37908.1 sialate O-acetylesterase [Flammeovirgaceae bacterium SG7u.111]
MTKLFRFYTLLFLCFTAINGFAQVRLPKLIGDRMVLQRDVDLKVWGWASAGEKVSVKFNKKSYKATADSEGSWQVVLKKQKAGGPYQMEIKGKNEIVLKDILVGDVWLCSGQSNMVHYFGRHKERFAKEIEKADFPEIRQFLVPRNPVLDAPQKDLPEGSWKQATPENVLAFSVVGYFFAKKLYETYGVPMGFINSSVGGTPIEAWTSEDGMKDFTEILKTVLQNKDSAYVNGANRAAALERKEIQNGLPKDKGMDVTKKWYDPEYVPKNWSRINIPGYWEDQGVNNLDGVVWFRKEIEIPASMAGKAAKLFMGRIVDADEMYVNGELVGRTTYKYPQREYQVPEGVLKGGENTFVVRVTNQGGKGGFIPDKPYFITAGIDTVDLKGYWSYKVGAVYKPVQIKERGVSAQHQPTALYNGMIAPFTNYQVKGAVWYQGESNGSRPVEYEKLLPALIYDWRAQWGQEDLPFLYVQLPNYMNVDYSPAESKWARLRESQLKALGVENTAMAVAIDLGEWNDVHPGNKKPVGERLALAARHLVYQEQDLVFSGPIFSSATVEKQKVVLSFNHVGSGLMSKDGEELRWFAIAGMDQKYVWATAEIQGDKVVLWSDEISSPVYVRYAWQDNPDKVNFYNKEGLPASPFQTKVKE